MRTHILTNGIIFIGLLAIPVAAELLATPFDPGAGLEILLYKPFPYAFILLASLVFIIYNGDAFMRNGRSAAVGVAVGLGMFLFWIATTYLVVAALHLSLGGQL